MFKKCILILAASCMMYSCATQTESNPFLTEFQTPNGVPPFDKIKLEHYEPAFQKGIEEQNANIQAIIDNTEAPTFENVIVALDNSSPTLDRVGGVFFNLTEAETTDELTALSMKLAPTLAEHEDNISLNQELFKKVDAVYNKGCWKKPIRNLSVPVPIFRPTNKPVCVKSTSSFPHLESRSATTS